jgi:hypothetical protein
MTFFEKLFSDFFNSEAITPQRLYDGGQYVLVQLMSKNTGARYDTLISRLTADLDNLEIDLGGVDQGGNLAKDKTVTNDEAQAAFKKTMSDQSGVIANALGGFTSEGYNQFYPKGITEYSKVTKTKMPLLTKRVYDQAVIYATQLGTTLTDLLKSFKAMWTNSRSVQETQFGVVETARIARTKNYTAVSASLIVVTGTLLTIYPAESATLNSYFDFTMFFNTTLHRHVNFTGTLAAKERRVIANLHFLVSEKILSKNTGLASTIKYYIVHNTIDAAGPIFIELTPGTTSDQLPLKYGAAGDSYFVVENMDTENEASY